MLNPKFTKGEDATDLGLIPEKTRIFLVLPFIYYKDIKIDLKIELFLFLLKPHQSLTGLGIRQDRQISRLAGQETWRSSGEEKMKR